MKKQRKSWREYVYDFFGLLLYPFRWLIEMLSDKVYDLSCKMQQKKTAKGGSVITKGRIGKEKTRRLVFIWAVLAIPILQFCVFYILVNIEAIFLAFQVYDIDKTSPTFKQYIFTQDVFLNFRNFLNKLINEPQMGQYILNSVWLYLLSQITMPLSLFFSFFIVKKLRLGEFYRVILFLPAVIPGMVFVTMYKYMLEDVIPELLHIFFKIEPGKSYFLREDMAFWLMWFYGFWTGFGSGILIYCGTMSRVPDSLIECARLDGITLFKELWYIYIPLIFPTIATFWLLGVAKFLMTGNAAFTFYEANAPQSARTLSYYFYTQVMGSTGAYRLYPEVSAGSLLVTCVGVPIALFMRHIVNKYIPPVEY